MLVILYGCSHVKALVLPPPLGGATGIMILKIHCGLEDPDLHRFKMQLYNITNTQLKQGKFPTTAGNKQPFLFLSQFVTWLFQYFIL